MGGSTAVEGVAEGEGLSATATAPLLLACGSAEGLLWNEASLCWLPFRPPSPSCKAQDQHYGCAGDKTGKGLVINCKPLLSVCILRISL